MANSRAERSRAFVYDQANFDNELLVAALDLELRVGSVALETHAGLSQVVGKGDKVLAVVAACWNISPMLAVGSLTAKFGLGHILGNLGKGRSQSWLLLRS